MKLKLSILAGALALAVSAQANAAINGNSTTAGGGDLILSVWDTNTNTSYTRDLGVTMASFLASPTKAISSATDATWATFMAGVAATDTTNWNVVGMTGATSYLFTSATVPTPDALTTVKTFNSASDLYMTGASALAGANTSVIVSGATTSGYAGYQFGSNFGGKATGFSNSSALNLTGTSTMNFYGETALTRNGNGVVTAFASPVALASNGTLTVGTVAAVPEPGEWALMLSGFGLIGFVAARRKKNAGVAFA